MLALASVVDCNRMAWAVAMLDTTGTCKKDRLVQWYVCPLPILRAIYQCLLEHCGARLRDCNINNMRSEHCLNFIQERMANLNRYTGLLFHYTGQSWDRPPRTPPLSKSHKPWGTSIHTHTHTYPINYFCRLVQYSTVQYKSNTTLWRRDTKTLLI